MSYEFTNEEIKRALLPSVRQHMGYLFELFKTVSLASCRLMHWSHPSRNRAKGLNYTKCKN